MQGTPRFMYSSAENTGTPVIIRNFIAHALRSLILLYMYVHRSIYIRILNVFSRTLLTPADLLLAAGAVHLLYICCTAAIVGVVVQPDGGALLPGGGRSDRRVGVNVPDQAIEESG
jgi:hypothetical protein